MAKKKKGEQELGGMYRTLTPPGLFLVRMLIFLTLVAFITAILHRQLFTAFMHNPGLNGLILAVLFFGIIYSFRQVVRLYPEIRWVNAFRIADPGLAISHQPKLLAPMATMLRDRKGAISITPASMSAFMDSIGARLDEARDTGRYMVGLLVFLGLLGTFWGLLDTIQSVGKAIGTIDTSGNDSVALFSDLKAGLAAPLQGMGTAFASSLFGLAGSLILGLLELQASHAQNRFYNELEEWLSGITELTPGSATASGDTINRQIAATLYGVQRALEEFNQRAAYEGVDGGEGSGVRELAEGLNELVGQMRAEQQVVRQWVDEQSQQQGELANVLKYLAQNAQQRGG